MWRLLLSDPTIFLEVYGKRAAYLALRVAAVVCVIAYVLNMEGIFSSSSSHSPKLSSAGMLINTMHAKLQWDAASVASSFKKVPRSTSTSTSTSSQRSEDRDEYGHLTFAAQCNALEEEGVDPGWPLLSPTAEEGVEEEALGFATARDLCEAMRTLPERFKVYAFNVPWAARRRYWLARLAPTFNRGYDVEGHLVENMQRAPFAVTDPAAATAFLIPVRPYLERVAAYPNDGREAMMDKVRSVIGRAKNNSTNNRGRGKGASTEGRPGL